MADWSSLLSILDYTVGRSSALSVSIGPDAIARFAELSGDFAPIHMDEAFARRMGFEGPLVHGAYLSALISRFVGMEFPGPFAILERLDVTFRKPCYAPAELTIRGSVDQVSEAVSTIILKLNLARAPDDVVATAKSWHRIL